MSFWDRGLIDGTADSFNKSSNQNKSTKQEKGKLESITLFLVFYFLLTYPFALVGMIPYLIVKSITKTDEKKHIGELEYIPMIERLFPIFTIGAVFFLVLNMTLLFLAMPNAYLSNYLLFPFNFIKSNLKFNFLSVFTLLLGSTGQALIMLSISSFVSKRQVISKEERQEKIKQSKEYKDLKENKFERTKRARQSFEHEKNLATLSDNAEEKEQFKGKIFIGLDEYGKPMLVDFSELNQHGVATGTTGSGKTTLLMNFVDYAIQHKIPILYIDGKGAVDTLESIQKLARKHKREVKVFSDTGNVRYNPIKHGNSVMVRDKLINLSETESAFYTSAAKLLLQSTVQLIDLFNIPRTLENVSEYTLPRSVLLLFIESLKEKKEDILFVEVPVEEPKKKKKEKKEPKENDEQVELIEISDEELEELSKLETELEEENIEETRLEELDPNRMPLESLYYLIRNYKWLLTPQEAKIFKQLFIRYEHKDNPFYLYATSEALQTNINMLIDSELGHLFNTDEEGIEEVDLLEDSKNNEIVFITLNGLVYKDYINTLAQFFIGDVNYLASEHYIYNEHMPFLLICDEPSVYFNENFIDTINKGRGAGLHALISPQTLADIDIIDPLLTKQMIGNCNSFYIGQSNGNDEIELWTTLIGTYNDVEMTTMTEQEQGYSDVERADWSASRGTMRNVRNFIIHPDVMKDLRQGEFIVYRKANNIREQARRVYASNSADRKQAHEKNN